MIELTLPYPPSVNNYKRVGRLTKTKNGKLYQPRVNTNETNMFYFQVIMIVNNKISTGIIKPFLDHKVALYAEIDLYPSRNSGDIDNRIKPILDALQKAGLIANDYQFSKILITRKEVMPYGQTIIRIQSVQDLG